MSPRHLQLVSLCKPSSSKHMQQSSLFPTKSTQCRHTVNFDTYVKNFSTPLWLENLINKFNGHRQVLDPKIHSVENSNFLQMVQ